MSYTQQDYNKLYKKYIALAKGFFVSKIHSSVQKFEIADDLAHESVTKALLKLETFDTSKNFDAWFYSICNNHFKDYCKSKATRNNAITDIADFSIYSNISEYESKYHYDMEYEENKDSCIKYDKDMSCLADLEQKVMDMFFIQGYNKKEIAEIFNVDYNTIRNVINKYKNMKQHKVLQPILF